jgi:DNA polymerase
LYRLLWRLKREGAGLLRNLTDPDVRRLETMAKRVKRDVHKMHAFVRFRKVETEAGEHYIAFHRPDGYILRRAAPFFRERFGGMRWTILTPDESVTWDGEELRFGPGVEASAAPGDDQLEDAWRTYYASVFNPARVKLKAMKAELPVRHWRTLPETQVLPDLLAGARSRVSAMVEQPGRAAGEAGCAPMLGAAPFLPPVMSLPALAEAVQKCRGCELACQAGVTQAVLGEGPAGARCMFVGEQPGDVEDRTGRPFVGPAGRLMDEMLEEAGLERREVYVTNTVKHFRFELRGKMRIHSKPSARNVSACLPWLEAEIAAVRPEMIVALGSTAAQAIMGRDFRVTRQRGQVLSCRHAPWFMATLHPSAILRMREPEAGEARRQFVEDMRVVRRRLEAA